MSTLWKDLLEKVMNDSVCDDEFDDAIVALLNASKAERDMGEEVEGVRGRSFPLTSDGLGVRKVRREDYSRGPKTKKSKEDSSINLKWMSWIRDERIIDPATKEAKRFRRLFRIPFPIFEAIVTSCKSSDYAVFNYAKTDSCGEFNVPLEIKILFCLRVLAGGIKINDAAEMTQFMENSTGNDFFSHFNIKFCEMFEHIHIRPLEGEELLQSMATYARMGLPGAIGSIDAVFEAWNKVPKEMHNMCDGDKGMGVLFEVIVTHEKLILAVAGPYGSTINDKISVKYSEFLDAMKEKLIGKDIKYKIRTGLGQDDFIELSNIYLISDGGYLEWPETICGYPYSSIPVRYKFSDWIASVRKDVECLFGILKARFMKLKNPCNVHSSKLMRSIFVTCCILNNMILRYDGLDSLWESDVNWTTLNPDPLNEDVAEEDEADRVDQYLPVHFDPATFVPPSLAEMEPLDYHGECTDTQKDFHMLRDLLARHLQFTYATGNLRWPKVRKNCINPEGVDLNKLVREQFPGAGDHEI